MPETVLVGPELLEEAMFLAVTITVCFSAVAVLVGEAEASGVFTT